MTDGTNLRYGGIALWCLIAAGCAQLPNDPTEPAIGSALPTPVEPAAALQDPPFDPTVADLAVDAEGPLEEPALAPEPEVVSPQPPTADARPETTTSAVVAAAAQAAPEVTPPRAASSSAPAPAPVTATLDFSSLLTRLRKTKAIGLLTKVAFKSESDTLLERFRAYHTQQGAATLADLRRSYDSLFHKLYSLLEAGDPPLARDIDRSQAAIWEFLSDPRTFSASPLLAGA